MKPQQTNLTMEKQPKAIFINGSPRKNRNTAQMLENDPKDLQAAYDLGKRLVEKAKEQ